MQQVITVANPAPGQDPATTTVPAGKYWLIRSMSMKLVTDANVAARGPKVILDDGSKILYETGNSGTGQAASSTCQYSYAIGCAMETASPASGVFKTFPMPYMVLFPGYRIQFVTGALQVGDQWSDIRIVVNEELMEQGIHEAMQGG